MGSDNIEFRRSYLPESDVELEDSNTSFLDDKRGDLIAEMDFGEEFKNHCLWDSWMTKELDSENLEEQIEEHIDEQYPDGYQMAGFGNVEFKDRDDPKVSVEVELEYSSDDYEAFSNSWMEALELSGKPSQRAAEELREEY